MTGDNRHLCACESGNSCGLMSIEMQRGACECSCQVGCQVECQVGCEASCQTACEAGGETCLDDCSGCEQHYHMDDKYGPGEPPPYEVLARDWEQAEPGACYWYEELRCGNFTADKWGVSILVIIRTWNGFRWVEEPVWVDYEKAGGCPNGDYYKVSGERSEAPHKVLIQ